MHRHLSTLLVAVVFGLSRYAQRGCGAGRDQYAGRTHHVLQTRAAACRTNRPRPVAAGGCHARYGPRSGRTDQDSSLGRAGQHCRHRPSTTTDANGGFTLSGVPAALPLALMVTSSTGPPLMLNGPSLVVGAGQTRDLGSLGLAGCGDAGAVLTEAPPVPPVDGIELTAPGQPDELPETADSAAQPADQGVVTDESN